MKTLSLIIFIFFNYIASAQTYHGYILEAADGLMPVIKQRHFFNANLDANANHTHDANRYISRVDSLGGWILTSGTNEVNFASMQFDSAAVAFDAPIISIDAVDQIQLQAGGAGESDILLLDDVIRIDQDAGEVEIEDLDRDDDIDDVVGIDDVTGKLYLRSAAGGSAHDILDDGAARTARAGLNFISTSTIDAVITDDSGGDESEVTHNVVAGSIDDAELGTGIDVIQLADGTVTSAELQFINTLSSNAQTQINAKLTTTDTTAMLTGYVRRTGNSTIAGVKTFTSDPVIPDEAYDSDWNGDLEPVTQNAIWDAELTEEVNVKIFQGLGSTTKATAFGTGNINGTVALADGTARYAAIWLEEGMTATGVKFYMGVQGAYTADNNNYIALYSYSGGTLTQVAITANNGNLWKATVNTFVSENFAVAYPVTASGVYFIGCLYNQSAQSTAPSLGINGTSTNLAVQSADFTNSAKMHGTLAGQTALPTPQVMSGITAVVTQTWFAIY